VDVIRILLAIILPPVGVFLQVGIGLHFWLNILLTLWDMCPALSMPSGLSCESSDTTPGLKGPRVNTFCISG
jgi:uncharacterized membrane protein YqaE (UPF0057 family)